MTTLTQNQIIALLFNTAARAGEVGVFPAMSLQAAGSVVNGVFTPSGNSGYSLGFFQNDFGQRQNSQILIDAYNAWAPTAGQPLLTANESSTLITNLNSNGHSIVSFP